MGEALNDRLRSRATNARANLDPSPSELRHASTGNKRIGVFAAGHNASDTGFDKSLRAWTGLSVMAARLESDVCGRTSRAIRRVAQGDDFSMRATCGTGRADPGDLPVAHDHAADSRVRGRSSESLARLLARKRHPACVIFHGSPLRPRSLTSVSSALMNSSMSRKDLYTEAKRT